MTVRKMVIPLRLKWVRGPGRVQVGVPFRVSEEVRGSGDVGTLCFVTNCRPEIILENTMR